jgi:hypothetical protein
MDEGFCKSEFEMILNNNPKINRKNFLYLAEGVINNLDTDGSEEPFEIKGIIKDYMNLAREVWKEHNEKNKQKG